jgi:hypothetical protein
MSIFFEHKTQQRSCVYFKCFVTQKIGGGQACPQKTCHYFIGQSYSRRNDKSANLVQVFAKLALLLNAAHQCCKFNLKLTKEEKTTTCRGTQRQNVHCPYAEPFIHQW